MISRTAASAVRVNDKLNMERAVHRAGALRKEYGLELLLRTGEVVVDDDVVELRNLLQLVLRGFQTKCNRVLRLGLTACLLYTSPSPRDI